MTFEAVKNLLSKVWHKSKIVQRPLFWEHGWPHIWPPSGGGLHLKKWISYYFSSLEVKLLSWGEGAAKGLASSRRRGRICIFASSMYYYVIFHTAYISFVSFVRNQWRFPFCFIWKRGERDSCSHLVPLTCHPSSLDDCCPGIRVSSIGCCVQWV